jgi:hypothetical protein
VVGCSLVMAQRGLCPRDLPGQANAGRAVIAAAVCLLAGLRAAGSSRRWTTPAPTPLGGTQHPGTIMANRVAGGLLDRYLAGSVNLGEKADGPADQGGRAFGAHGGCDDPRARTRVHRMSARSDVRPADAGRLALASVALARPQWLLRATGSADGTWPGRVTRILGARYVV